MDNGDHSEGSVRNHQYMQFPLTVPRLGKWMANVFLVTFYATSSLGVKPNVAVYVD
jgi:hypothetical protein